MAERPSHAQLRHRSILHSIALVAARSIQACADLTSSIVAEVAGVQLPSSHCAVAVWHPNTATNYAAAP